MITTCEGGWHFYTKNHKRCDCGEKRSPMYRSPLRKVRDRIKFLRLQRRLRKQRR